MGEEEREGEGQGGRGEGDHLLCVFSRFSRSTRIPPALSAAASVSVKGLSGWEGEEVSVSPLNTLLLCSRTLNCSKSMASLSGDMKRNHLFVPSSNPIFKESEDMQVTEQTKDREARREIDKCGG